MKSRIFLILLTIVTLSFAQKDYQQVIFQRGKFNDQVPILNPILFRAYPVAIAPDTFQVYLITDILYDFLQFTRQQNDFLANFSIEANFINTETKLVYTKTWESTFRLNNFEETNSRDQFFFTLDSLQMPAGNYRLKLIYQDLQGKQHANLDLKFVVKQLPSIFARQKPLPLQKHIPFNQEMDILLNVFNRTGDPVKVNASLKAKDSNKIIYSQDSLFSISGKMGSLILKPNLMTLEEGTYSLNISYTANSDTIKQELPISIIWFQKPRSLYKIDYAIQPLELIVDPETFEQLKSGNDQEETENFRKFWLTRDPTPETAFNEVMYEFYTRVDSADIRWGGKRWMYGWKKEPGRTFLLYG
ncbi:MAG: GWxTD domain-containing protein [Calditrichia bacterium]